MHRPPRPASGSLGLLPLAVCLLAVVVVTLGCEDLSDDDDGPSDTGAMEDTGATEDTGGTEDTGPPTEPFTVTLDPTTDNFEEDRSGSPTIYRGRICLNDRLDPSGGAYIDGGCGFSGEDLLLGWTITSTDANTVHVAGSGVWNISSASAGEQGEGPFPGTTSWRVGLDQSVDFVLQSVVLGQTTYTAEFTATVNAGPRRLTVEEILFTPN